MTAILRTENLGSCPNCGAAECFHWCYATDLLFNKNDQTFEYHKCKKCKVVFLKVRPLETELGQLYPQDYAPYSSSTNAAGPYSRSKNGRFQSIAKVPRRVLERTKRLLNSSIDSYYARLTPGMTFLDFGCGKGAYLDRMRLKGCVTIGMDFSSHAVSIVEQKGHRALLVSETEWKNISDQSVDFVRMNHVLEHLYHPADILQNIRRTMKPQALLHIAVPNPGGLSARIFRRYWLGLDCPRHVMLYPPAALQGFLERAGFTVEMMVHEALTKDHIRSWAYWLRARGLIEKFQPTAYIGRTLFRLAAGLPMLVAHPFGMADRFHVFAREEQR